MVALNRNHFKGLLAFDPVTCIYSSMDLELLQRDVLSKLETDYQWDFTHDPVITTTIIHEWDYLDVLMGQNVTRGAKVVLSIGGGGNSQTHKYLSPVAEVLYVINPGVWDLTSYLDEFKGTEIIKIRGMGEDLPFKDCVLDAIEIPSTLDHVVDPKKVASEAFRTLQFGGKIGISLGNQQSWYRVLFRKLGIPFEDNHAHAHNFHFSPSAVEELLINSGFIDVDTLGTSYFKLPKFAERKIRSKLTLSIHRAISNHLLSKFFSRYRGGMFIVTGKKPFTT